MQNKLANIDRLILINLISYTCHLELFIFEIVRISSTRVPVSSSHNRKYLCDPDNSLYYVFE